MTHAAVMQGDRQSANASTDFKDIASKIIGDFMSYIAFPILGYGEDVQLAADIGSYHTRQP
jgi:hypothetical protein